MPSSFEEGFCCEFAERKFLQVSSKLRQAVMGLRLKHKVQLSPVFSIGFYLQYYILESNGHWELEQEFGISYFIGISWNWSLTCHLTKAEKSQVQGQSRVYKYCLHSTPLREGQKYMKSAMTSVFSMAGFR